MKSFIFGHKLLRTILNTKNKSFKLGNLQKNPFY